MEELEAKRAKLEAELANRSAPLPILHPSLAALYRQKVGDLADALRTPEAQADANQSLRKLIDKIVLTPQPQGYSIDLHGDLAGILTLASGKSNKTACAGLAEAVSQVSLVAGAGFEPAAFRL
jgi:site-specific DNA recombinase